jgi:orotate phosphoribosyltransferase
MFKKLKTRASKPSRGFLQKGQNVVVVEDLISTGNSSLLAVEACCRCKYKRDGRYIYYGFDVAEQNFKNANIDLYTLSNYQNLLNLAVAKVTLLKRRTNLERMERESFYLGYKIKNKFKDEPRKSKVTVQNQRTNYLTY